MNLERVKYFQRSIKRAVNCTEIRSIVDKNEDLIHLKEVYESAIQRIDYIKENMLGDITAHDMLDLLKEDIQDIYEINQSMGSRDKAHKNVISVFAKDLKRDSGIKIRYTGVNILARLEREAIIQVVKDCNENRTRASKILGLSIRCLRNKMKQYGEEVNK